MNNFFFLPAKMLLQDLLKHTPDKHPDHAPLKKALGLVEQVANSLDQDLQANEQRQRYMELSMATGAVVSAQN
jgi:hypothetical protein